jgi:hypothetical protein
MTTLVQGGLPIEATKPAPAPPAVEQSKPTRSLEAMIAIRHPSPEWATFFEVSSATGFSANRRADAIALGVWPSRGQMIHGFEVKRSRADWLKERDSPEKSDAIMTYCDFWWLVLASAKMAPASEVPPTWGILAANGDTLRVVRDAPKLEPQPLTRGFVAAMLRKITETTVPKSVLEERVAAAVAANAGCESYELRSAKQRVQELEKIIEDFQEASGISLNRYVGGRELGERVARLQTFSNVDGRDRLLQAKRHLEDLVGFIVRDLEVMAAVSK